MSAERADEILRATSTEFRMLLGTHEALRRLGFPSNDIYLIVGGVDDSNRPMLAISLRRSGREWSAVMPTEATSRDGAIQAWRMVSNAFNRGTDEALGEIWGEWTDAYSLPLIASTIRRKGLTVPADAE